MNAEPWLRIKLDDRNAIKSAYALISKIEIQYTELDLLPQIGDIYYWASHLGPDNIHVLGWHQHGELAGAAIALLRRADRAIVSSSIHLLPEHQSEICGAVEHLQSWAQEVGADELQVIVPGGQDIDIARMPIDGKRRSREQRTVFSRDQLAEKNLKTLASKTTGDTSIISWTGLPPDSLLEGFASIRFENSRRWQQFGEPVEYLRGIHQSLELNGHTLQVSALLTGPLRFITGYSEMIIWNDKHGQQNGHYISAEHRGKGHGKCVMIDCILRTMARFPKVATITGWADAANNVEHHLVRSIGFREAGTLDTWLIPI
jgi:RimJ/RimL family protein N-acetyltransferase